MGAKMWYFLPTTHMLTPHIKRKKCKKKIYTLPHCTRPTLQKKRLHDGARKKRETRETREKKKEEGKISLAVGLRDPPLGFAGRISAGSLPVCLFFFFLPVIQSLRLVLPEGSRHHSEPRHVAATHLATSRRPATKTHGRVSPAVGLIFS